MPELIVIENYDLNEFPIVDTTHPLDENSEIIKGDLHGNAITLINLLMRQGVMKLAGDENEQRENYFKLIKIYNTPANKLTIQDLNNFYFIIAAAKFTNNCRLICEGDVLADRAQNDLYMLLMLFVMHFNNVSFEIMLSNHDLSFIDAFENQFDLAARYHHIGIENSLINLTSLFNLKLVNKNFINYVVRTCYFPHLRVVSYSIDLRDHSMSLFNHAKIGLTTIAALYEVFTSLEPEKVLVNISYDTPKKILTSPELKESVPPVFSSYKKLAEMIDKINEKFQEKIIEENFIKFTRITQAKFVGKLPSEFPLVRLTWSREFNVGDEPISELPDGFKLYYFHGHDGKGKVEIKFRDYVINLDNFLGYGLTEKGEYTIVYNHGMVLSQKSLQVEEKKEIKKPAVSENTKFTESAKEIINIFEEYRKYLMNKLQIEIKKSMALKEHQEKFLFVLRRDAKFQNTITNFINQITVQNSLNAFAEIQNFVSFLQDAFYFSAVKIASEIFSDDLQKIVAKLNHVYILMRIIYPEPPDQQKFELFAKEFANRKNELIVSRTRSLFKSRGNLTMEEIEEVLKKINLSNTIKT